MSHRDERDRRERVGSAPTLDDKELTDSSNERTANLRPGRTQIDAPDIAGYRITAVLGEGGMGTVYAAEQEAPRRKVAIKVLHRGSQSAFLRFQTEAAVMARLDHPGIARVLEAGEAQGHPFLVMDFVDGTTLDEAAEPLPLRKRLELFVAICDAVHHAHVKGVIHRDLKPSNVMVRANDGRVIVLDFGVARLADDTTPGPTRAGELIGTPLYMSPEQARLRPDEVDARTDVYTLGVILYELASRELPYAAPRGLPLPVLSTLICDEPPVPLGKRDPALRGDLEAITSKALAKEPADRYQSVAALADDVRRHLDGIPVSVRMPGALERATRFVRRRPVVAASIAGGALAVITFAGVVTALWLEARSARSAAEVARSAAEQAGARTELARSVLETRTNELTLRQARSAVARDPTEALAWLATLPESGSDARVAAMIADEAAARGVSRDVLRGHVDEVHWVQPIGNGIVTGGYDGRVIVWDPSPRTVFTSDKGRVHVVQPSPDGRRIAIGGDGGTFVVVEHDGSGQEALGTFTGDVDHVAWSASGDLAAASDRGHVWMFPAGKGPGRELRGPGSSISALAFSSSGTELLAGDDAGTLRIWRMRDGSVTERPGRESIIGVYSDGSDITVVDAEGTIRTHGTTYRTNIKVKRVAFALDGSFVMLGGVGGEVVRVRGSTKEVIGMHRAQVRSLAVSADGAWSASGGDDGTLVVRSAVMGRELALRGHSGRIRHVTFAGNALYSGDSEGVVRRWELGELGKDVLATTGPAVTHIAIAGNRAVTIDEGGTLTQWDLVRAARERTHEITGRVTALGLVNQAIVAGTARGIVHWLGRRAGSISLQGTIEAIASNATHVAVATDEGPIEIFDHAGKRITTLSGQTEGTDIVAFDPSGKLLASGGQDRVVRVWRAGDASFALDAVLDGPTGDTHFLAFTPAGDRLVAAGNGGTVFAWRVTNGKVEPASRTVVAQHTGAVTALLVTDSLIASAGRDLTLTRATPSAPTERTTLPAAAVSLAAHTDGTLFAITRAGAAVRWLAAGPVVVEIEHGVRAAALVPGESRWALAFDDGAIVIVSLDTPSLSDVHARIRTLTSYRLPGR